MKRLFGNNINIVLKTNDEVFGILFDEEDDYVYIQSDVNQLITVPKENINYYISNSFQDITNKDRISISQPQLQPQPQPQPQPKQIKQSLSVYVNKILIVEIPVPPTFDLSTFHDDIMRVMLGNPDVQAVLAGRKQKSLNYRCGEIYITVDDDNATPLVADLNSPQPSINNSFSMSSSGSATSAFLNPSQMVARLNKAAKTKHEEGKDE